MKFFELIPTDTHIDFIGKFRYFMVLSLIILACVVFGAFTKGFNFGVDFTGGTVVQAKFTNPTSADDVRKLLGELGDTTASAVAVGQDNREYLITTRTVSTDKNAIPLNQRLTQKLGPSQIAILSVDIVGPKVGSELKWAAIRSLFYSIVLITIYIWFRFDIRFAPGATIAMIHDLLVVSGFYLFTGKEFTITAIAALLTIAGYSVNDTIVIYDRVRELLKTSGQAIPLPQVINHAINLTLSRTILTALATLLAVIPIAIWCTDEIKDFAEAMLIGIFVGIYSTVYIASPFTIYVEKWLEKRNKNTQRAPATA
ncbi:MAG: protein translocase subunit SecF [Deltaproteobacteria bacterium]|nr:protein translocase subunit SecF [Deltaproteobacteria bacterium]